MHHVQGDRRNHRTSLQMPKIPTTHWAYSDVGQERRLGQSADKRIADVADMA